MQKRRGTETTRRESSKPASSKHGKSEAFVASMHLTAFNDGEFYKVIVIRSGRNWWIARIAVCQERYVCTYNYPICWDSMRALRALGARALVRLEHLRIGGEAHEHEGFNFCLTRKLGGAGGGKVSETVREKWGLKFFVLECWLKLTTSNKIDRYILDSYLWRVMSCSAELVVFYSSVWVSYLTDWGAGAGYWGTVGDRDRERHRRLVGFGLKNGSVWVFGCLGALVLVINYSIGIVCCSFLRCVMLAGDMYSTVHTSVNPFPSKRSSSSIPLQLLQALINV